MSSSAGNLSAVGDVDEALAENDHPDDSQLTTVSSIALSEWGNDMRNELGGGLQSFAFLANTKPPKACARAVNK